MPATFDPKEMMFDDFVNWATGTVMLQLGEGTSLRDAMHHVCNQFAQNEPIRSVDQDNLRRLARSLQTMTEYARETSELWDKDQDMKVGKRLQAMAGTLTKYNIAMDDVHAIRKHWNDK